MTRRPLIAFSLAVAALAVAAAGCAKKVTEVDANFSPEGMPSPDARMIGYPDLPQVGQMYPVLRWIDSEFELYRFADANPSGFSPATYMGRGVVGGAVTPTSPLTNPGQIGATTLDELNYTGLRTPYDTLITMSWDQVPGAAGYWLQIFQNIGSTDQSVRTGIPSPFATEHIREYYIAYVTAPADSHKIGRDPAEVLYRRALLTGIEYLVRVSAVDPQGRMLATTFGDTQVQPGSGEYAIYRLGAVKVLPSRPTP